MSITDTIRIQQAAQTIQGLAVSYGVTIPKAHATAATVAAEARRLAQAQAPAPLSVPTTAAKVSAAVEKAANDRLLAAESRKVAQEIADRAELDAMRVLFDLRGLVLQAVADTFAKDLERFGTLLDSAPLEVTGDTSPEGAAGHVELLRVADQLTRSAGARLELAGIEGESRDAAEAWFVLDPRPDALLSAVTDAVAAGVPTSLAGWVRVHHLGASMAGPDQAAQRAARFGQALFHSGHATPDGGLKERTYAEGLALVPGASS